MTTAVCPVCNKTIASATKTEGELIRSHVGLVHPQPSHTEDARARPRRAGRAGRIAIGALVVAGLVIWGINIAAGAWPSRSSAAATSAEVGIQQVPVPSGSERIDSGPTAATATATYRVPAGIDLDGFYEAHLPIGDDLGTWNYCGRYPPAELYDGGRLYTRGSTGTETLEVNYRDDEVTVLFNADGWSC